MGSIQGEAWQEPGAVRIRSGLPLGVPVRILCPVVKGQDLTVFVPCQVPVFIQEGDARKIVKINGCPAGEHAGHGVKDRVSFQVKHAGCVHFILGPDGICHALSVFVKGIQGHNIGSVFCHAVGNGAGERVIARLIQRLQAGAVIPGGKPGAAYVHVRGGKHPEIGFIGKIKGIAGKDHKPCAAQVLRLFLCKIQGDHGRFRGNIRQLIPAHQHVPGHDPAVGVHIGGVPRTEAQCGIGGLPFLPEPYRIPEGVVDVQAETVFPAGTRIDHRAFHGLADTFRGLGRFRGVAGAQGDKVRQVIAGAAAGGGDAAAEIRGCLAQPGQTAEA